ncbi:MAG: LysM peptidoglycan-binding domain-containing protein [Flavobacteriales bacterium]|nr:LysM peptidoglycan-binding domain-containing protein [Flavobacteriales bacterium]
MKRLILISFMLQSILLWGQYDTVITKTTSGPDTTLIKLDDPIARMLDSTFLAYYFDNDDFTTDTALLNIYHYASNEVPLPGDSVIIARLNEMSENSPIAFSPHRLTLAYAKLYAQKKRKLTSRMLGASALYFPVFEEALARYQLPQELKYLPVIESALKATARSHMGASGLWQFMPRTAEGRGLEVGSYVDERSDLYKSTDAACRYLRDAYNIYEDWHLALASYNAGAGNVNKAIRRSNGKTNFWEVKEFLPKETQNYVPAFLGCAYAMTYHKEHNIYPVEPRAKFFELDSIHVNQRVRFDILENYLQITTKDLSFFNPSYIQGVIPNSKQDRVLLLPRMKIGVFEQNKDSIYAKSKRKSSLPSKTPVNRVLTYHTVKSGDYLGKIAEKYHCSVSDIKKWNYLRSDKLKTGKKLKIYKRVSKSSSKTSHSSSSSSKPKEKEVPRSPGDYYYYTIKKGDTLWDVAQRYKGVSMEDLKRSNSHLNFNNLKTGTKIKIPK